MTPEEAQQTQTIARIKDEYEKHFGRTYHAFSDFAPLVTELYGNLGMLLEIVDSQAQKIADQAQTIEINAAYAIELQGKIAEQAKEIERLQYKSKALELRCQHGV